MKKRLGIIGGMGPKATAIFFNNIVDKTDAQTDNEHIEIAILNNTKIPDRTEAILNNNHGQILQELLRSIRELESLGVHHIAVPCNTSCYFLDKLQMQTQIPLINIVRETVMHIAKLANGKNVKVGVMATDGVIRTELYKKELEKNNFTYVATTPHVQKLIMNLIYNQIKKTGKGNIADLEYILESLSQAGCDYIILGCTELSYFPACYDLPNNVVDALEILTKVSIEMSGYKYLQSPRKLI